LDVLAAFTKPFRGPAWRNNRCQAEVKFYDEREWRYVPIAQDDKPLFLNWKTYRDTSRRDNLHRRFKAENAIPVGPDDIQYLIIPYDREEKNILQLQHYLTRRYSRKDAILVTTAIMTDDCLTEDV